MKCLSTRFKITLTALLASTFIFTIAHADSINVIVTCSNGRNIPNLPVFVTDSQGQKIPGIERTNSRGVFIIPNSELYTEPFYMWFQTPSGSTCGSYYIYVDSSNVGKVQLQYYPADLPCSCSKLVQ